MGAQKLGIKKLIVAVNKMDSTTPTIFSKARFEKMKNLVNDLLLPVEYNVDDIAFIPVSASKSGHNLVDVSEKLSWFEGTTMHQNNRTNVVKTLLDALEHVERTESSSDSDLDLRFVIDTVFSTKRGQIDRKKGSTVLGRVVNGTINVKDRIFISPSNRYATVKLIRMGFEQVMVATTGDNVALQISHILPTEILPGHIISHANAPAKKCSRFTAKVTILNNLKDEIKPGYCPVVHCHAAYFSCVFHKIISKLDPNRAVSFEENPESIENGETAIVEMIPQKKSGVCVESIDKYPSLARFVIRKKGTIVGWGEIQSVQFAEKKEKKKKG